MTEDDVRPFFGERSEPVGTVPLWTPTASVEAMTPLERAHRKIDVGECPTTGCPGVLDSEQACGMCGWSLVEWRMRMRLDVTQAKADYVPTLSRLFVDEYSPAQVDEDEAAA